MARIKDDYLDAISFIGATLIVGPTIFGLINFILGNPQNFGTGGSDAVAYVVGMFFFTGLWMILYSSYQRIKRR